MPLLKVLGVPNLNLDSGSRIDKKGSLSVNFAGEMARLVLNCDGVHLVTHELVNDVITIGRDPSKFDLA